MIPAVAVLSGLAGLVFGGLLAARVRVPPVLVGLFVTLPVVVAANTSAWLADSAARASAEQVPMGMRSEIYASTMQSAMASWGWSSLALPGIGLLLVGCVIGALRASNRAFGLAAFPALLGMALLMGIARDRLLYFESFSSSPGGLLTVPVLLVLLLLTAIAFVGTDSEKSETSTAGFEAAAAAGLGFLAAAAALSIRSSGLTWGTIFDALATVPPDMSPKLLANAIGVAAPESSRGVATTTWAAAIALAGLGVGATASGIRRVGVVLAVPVVLAAPMLVGAANPVERVMEFERAEQRRFFAYPTKDYQLAVGAPTLRGQRVPRGTVLRVSQRRILLDDEPVAKLERVVGPTGAEMSALDAEQRDALQAALTEERALWKTVAGGAMADSERSRQLVLQLDKRTAWSLLRPVLTAANQAGYTELRFQLLEGNAIRPIWAGSGEPITLSGLPVVRLRPDAMVVPETDATAPFSMEGDETPVKTALVDLHRAEGQVVLLPDDSIRWEQIVRWMDIARAVEPVRDRSSWDDPTPLFPDVWLADRSHLPEPEDETDEPSEEPESQ